VTRRVADWEMGEARGAGALPVLNQMEGLADELLGLVAMQHKLHVDPFRMLAGLELTPIEWAPKGSDGWMLDGRIHINTTRPEHVQLATLAKEISRWWLDHKGFPVATQDLMIDDFALCWQMPRCGVRRVFARAGGFTWAVRALVAAFRDLTTPARILERAAQCCDAAVILFPAEGGRLLVAPGTHQERKIVMPRSAEWELVEEARETRDILPGPMSTLAVSYRDGTGRGVALVNESPATPDEREDEFMDAIHEGEAWDEGIDLSSPARPPSPASRGDYP
jgi:hypothetical protein